jgi:ABC-type multidrug transport system fused ATPase/permease subunit
VLTVVVVVVVTVVTMLVAFVPFWLVISIAGSDVVLPVVVTLVTLVFVVFAVVVTMLVFMTLVTLVFVVVAMLVFVTFWFVVSIAADEVTEKVRERTLLLLGLDSESWCWCSALGLSRGRDGAVLLNDGRLGEHRRSGFADGLERLLGLVGLVGCETVEAELRGLARLGLRGVRLQVGLHEVVLCVGLGGAYS